MPQGRLIYSRASENYASSGALTASGLTDSEYPITNVFNLDPSNPFKSTGTTVRLVWDFTTPVGIPIIALGQHSLLAGLAGVRFEGNTSNAWVTPALSRTMTIPAARADGFSSQPFIDLSDNGTQYRYWSFAVTSANDVAVAFAEIWLVAETKRELSLNLSWGAEDEYHRHVDETDTDEGVWLGYDRGVTTRMLEGEIQTKDAGYADHLAWWLDARGRARPVLIIPDPNTNEAWFVRHRSPRLRRKFVANSWHQFAQVGWEELSPGIALR